MKTSKTDKRRASPRAARVTKKHEPKGRRAPVSAAPKATRRAAAASVARRAAPAGTAAQREIELEAAVLRRLLKHFDERKDVQNIDLMILAGFCRNCLSKWYVEAAQQRGLEVDMETAREKIYGMPYSEWRERFQQPATEDQLKRFKEAEQRKEAAGKG